jgi:hypothetical protein
MSDMEAWARHAVLFGTVGCRISPGGSESVRARTQRIEMVGAEGMVSVADSFISTMARRGDDQQNIGDLVGHQTDEQRRRNRLQ